MQAGKPLESNRMAAADQPLESNRRRKTAAATTRERMSRYKVDRPLSQATQQIPPTRHNCFKACAQHWCCLVRAPRGRGGHCVAALAPLLPTHMSTLSANLRILSAILRISRSSSHTRKRRSSLAASIASIPAYSSPVIAQFMTLSHDAGDIVVGRPAGFFLTDWSKASC